MRHSESLVHGVISFQGLTKNIARGVRFGSIIAQEYQPTPPIITPAINLGYMHQEPHPPEGSPVTQSHRIGCEAKRFGDLPIGEPPLDSLDEYFTVKIAQPAQGVSKDRSLRQRLAVFVRSAPLVGRRIVTCKRVQVVDELRPRPTESSMKKSNLVDNDGIEPVPRLAISEYPVGVGFQQGEQRLLHAIVAFGRWSTLMNCEASEPSDNDAETAIEIESGIKTHERLLDRPGSRPGR